MVVSASTLMIGVERAAVLIRVVMDVIGYEKESSESNCFGDDG